MESGNKSSPLNFGSWLFYLCWLSSLIFIIVIIFSDYFIFNSTQQFFMIFLIVALLILPFLKSISIGDFFKVEIREVKKSVQELREKLIEVQLSNSQSTTIINSITEFGEKISTPTISESEKLYNIAEELKINKKYIESLKYYKLALESDTRNWLAAFNLGAIYLVLNDHRVPKDSWNFTENERLSNALFYSQYATKIDKNHYGQFFNLALAQQHTGGDKMLELSINSFDNTIDILERDPSLHADSRLLTNYGKCLHFKAMSLFMLNRIEDAIENDKKAIDLFENCPEPKPTELLKWLDQSKNHLNELTRK